MLLLHIQFFYMQQCKTHTKKLNLSRMQKSICQSYSAQIHSQLSNIHSILHYFFLFQSISGNYAPIIVPPSWIVKLPSKGNFKSSIRVSNKNQANNKKNKLASKRGKKDDRREQRAFIVKPIPSAEVIPVIVYINPKSGGNQGVKLLGKFQQLLNPRQVFDLTQGGPKMG